MSPRAHLRRGKRRHAVRNRAERSAHPRRRRHRRGRRRRRRERFRARLRGLHHRGRADAVSNGHFHRFPPAPVVERARALELAGKRRQLHLLVRVLGLVLPRQQRAHRPLAAARALAALRRRRLLPVHEGDEQNRERQVDGEEGAEDDHGREVHPRPRAHRVLRVVHDVRPPLQRDALENREPRVRHVVETRDAVVGVLEPAVAKRRVGTGGALVPRRRMRVHERPLRAGSAAARLVGFRRDPPRGPPAFGGGGEARRARVDVAAGGGVHGVAPTAQRAVRRRVGERRAPRRKRPRVQLHADQAEGEEQERHQHGDVEQQRHRAQKRYHQPSHPREPL